MAQESLAKRTFSSTVWQSASSLIGTGIMFVRSILLARWLPIETFGVYGFAGALINITVMAATFGMAGAFLHRSEENEDESEAAAAHFTLKSLFIVIWALVLSLVALIFVAPEYRTALLILTAVHAVSELMQTPRLILIRRVAHRRLSVMRILDILISSVIAVILARRGWFLWALIATDVISLIISGVGLYIWRPVWRPRLRWSPPVIKYFVNFSLRSSLAGLLAQGLDRVDDLWTGSYLGSTAMGLYTKAYAFATYPRVVIANPLNKVSAGSYAELKGDRYRLSQAFFRINAVLVRSSFLMGGLLALIAPEFIRLLLGPRWLPMLEAFRLMLVFTLLDPIKLTVADLFVAVGQPERIVYARSAQLLVLLGGIVILGPRFGIAGVALAVDAMLVVGIGLLLWQAKAHVDFSFVRLFAAPLVALIVGMTAALGFMMIPGLLGPDWRNAVIKTAIFVSTYAGLLLVIERRQTQKIIDWVYQTVRA